MERFRRPSVVAIVVLVASACTADPGEAPTPRTEGSVAPPTATPTATPAPTPTPEPTPTPVPTESLTETIDLANFTNPTVVDNEWFPLVPGTRFTWEGGATIDGERLPRKVVFTVTDLTKVVAGVETVVGYDLDYTDGVLEELEIALWAQDDDGVVWHFGQYPEVWEDGAIVETPAWIHGAQDAVAGISMKSPLDPFGPSYSQGWGPAVGWNDRASVFEMGSETCVPAGCYTDVLVINEFARDEPDAHQLKYYASGVGNVRVGWAGTKEMEREELELVKIEMLTPEQLAEVRKTVLAQDGRGFENVPEVWAATSPAR